MAAAGIPTPRPILRPMSSSEVSDSLSLFCSSASEEGLESVVVVDGAEEVDVEEGADVVEAIEDVVVSEASLEVVSFSLLEPSGLPSSSMKTPRPASQQPLSLSQQ